MASRTTELNLEHLKSDTARITTKRKSDTARIRLTLANEVRPDTSI